MKKRVLVIAAHPDDEVLGCGGTIAKHIRNGDELFLLVLTDGESSREIKAEKMRTSSLSASCQILSISNFKQLNFLDSQLDSYPILDIIRAIEVFSKGIDPHIVYTHLPIDLNQDHRVAHLATLTAFRPLPSSSLEKILSYEVPSSTECGISQLISKFTPNYFESLTPEDTNLKSKALLCYKNELRPFPHPRSMEYIQALLTVRGASVGVESAEAFFLERLISR